MVSFLKQQIEKPYDLDLNRLNTDVDSSKWYCSELCYAAYKNIGVDIGVRRDKKGKESYLQNGCLPSDIYNCYNTYEKYILDNKHIDIQLKDGDRWYVMIHNNTCDNYYV